jgi:hypothetical protein
MTAASLEEYRLANVTLLLVLLISICMIDIVGRRNYARIQSFLVVAFHPCVHTYKTTQGYC